MSHEWVNDNISQPLPGREDEANWRCVKCGFKFYGKLRWATDENTGSHTCEMRQILLVMES